MKPPCSRKRMLEVYEGEAAEKRSHPLAATGGWRSAVEYKLQLSTSCPLKTLELGRCAQPCCHMLYEQWWCVKGLSLLARAQRFHQAVCTLGTNLGVDGDISGCDMSYRNLKVIQRMILESTLEIVKFPCFFFRGGDPNK